mmetsp:Transcript_59328/g.171938  ORF Transcript_59328/g.171938 Transcript_59328/m.171938 type:complete len:267 (+) Transcript_59328:1211-2011(+)
MRRQVAHGAEANAERGPGAGEGPVGRGVRGEGAAQGFAGRAARHHAGIILRLDEGDVRDGALVHRGLAGEVAHFAREDPGRGQRGLLAAEVEAVVANDAGEHAPVADAPAGKRLRYADEAAGHGRRHVAVQANPRPPAAAAAAIAGEGAGHRGRVAGVPKGKRLRRGRAGAGGEQCVGRAAGGPFHRPRVARGPAPLRWQKAPARSAQVRGDEGMLAVPEPRPLPHIAGGRSLQFASHDQQPCVVGPGRTGFRRTHPRRPGHVAPG